MVLGALESLLKYVNILPETSAILIGKNFTVDGFAKRPVRVVTHAHYDHVVGLRDNIFYSRSIVATPITHDLILTLGYIGGNNIRALYRAKRVDLGYHEEYIYGDEKLTLLPAEHIIGAAQVLIETDNYRIGYTGDFKLGGKTIVMSDLDVLIIESTYGDPSYRRPFKYEVEDLLVDLVYDGLSIYGKVAIYGYHGKLQEVMLLLRRNGITVPFIMSERIYAVTRVIMRYGYDFGEYYSIKHREAKHIMMKDKYILFDHFNKARKRRLNDRVLHIVLSGWEFNEPIRRVDEYTWLVALSDHADFDELIQYVEEAKPKIVVVDGSREGNPAPLAKELCRRGWRALVLPAQKNINP